MSPTGSETNGIERRALEFSAPREVRLLSEELPPLTEDDILVESEVSAVSGGTEMLIYRGEAPPGIALDETIGSLGGELRFPLRYGYSLVGRVLRVGAGVDPGLRGSRVFLFHPHASHAVVPAASAIRISDQIPPERAAFLPNLETAVNLLLDGAPLIGERVAVFGLGVVGLLTTLLLGRMLRKGVVAVEPRKHRRSLALSLAPDARCVSPEALDEAMEVVLPDFEGDTETYAPMRSHYTGFDLVYELSGRPETVNRALEVVGFDGRVVIGSWYGNKTAPVSLGGRFHRGRTRIISSQVSTVDPLLSGRWTSHRRLMTAKSLLDELPLERLVSHELSFDDAPAGYRRLAEGEAGMMQLLFRYGG